MAEFLIIERGNLRVNFIGSFAHFGVAMQRRWEIFRPDLQIWTDGLDADQIAMAVVCGKLDLAYQAREIGNAINWDHRVGSLLSVTDAIALIMAGDMRGSAVSNSYERGTLAQWPSSLEVQAEPKEVVFLENVKSVSALPDLSEMSQDEEQQLKSTADDLEAASVISDTGDHPEAEVWPTVSELGSITENLESDLTPDVRIRGQSEQKNEMPAGELREVANAASELVTNDFDSESEGDRPIKQTTATRIDDGFDHEIFGVVQDYDPFGRGKGTLQLPGLPNLSFSRAVIVDFVSPSEVAGAFVKVKIRRRAGSSFVVGVSIQNESSPAKVKIRERESSFRSELREFERNRGKRGHGSLLTSWATIHLDTQVQRLARKVLEGESWGFRSGSDPYKILKSYLGYTFYRLMWQDKIAFSETHACFNTGLVDKFFRPIYAFFERKREFETRPFRFVDFIVEGEGPFRQIFTMQFPRPPQQSSYITKLEHIFFDPDAEIKLQQSHIIQDGVKRGRFPVRFLLRYKPDGLEDPADINRVPSRWFLDYADILKTSSGQDSLFHLMEALQKATEVAKERLRSNYRTAIPSYYPKIDGMSLLLPLCLVKRSVPDTVLVLRYIRPDASYGATVFTPDMAYLNARLVSRPLSDWLKPEEFEEQAREENEGLDFDDDDDDD